LAELWPAITSRKGALPEADKYSKITDKRGLLIESE
jgi:hypothetical protein